MVDAKVTGLDQLARDMQKLIPESQKKFYKLAATAIYKDVVRHFEQEKDSSGTKWARFKWPDGKVRNQRPTKRGGTKVLQDTGRLKGSVVPFVEKESAGARTNVDYAIYHNDGTKTIPKREFGYVGDETMGKLEDYLAAEIRREWGSGIA